MLFFGYIVDAGSRLRRIDRLREDHDSAIFPAISKDTTEDWGIPLVRFKLFFGKVSTAYESSAEPIERRR